MTMKRMRRANDMARRDKMAKMLNMVAPGIDLFPPPPDEEGNGFLFFSQDSLELENDMGYTRRRSKLPGHGFISTQLDTQVLKHSI